MSRLVYVCIISLPFVLYYIWKVDYIEKHDSSYTENERYKFARRMITIMKHNGRIQTDVFGAENLPNEGGYVMYSNHQGKYDTLGIMSVHEKPCTVMMDEERSHLILADQFITLLKGCRIDKKTMKTQMKAILSVTAEVKAGRRYIIFPEGGYCENKNDVNRFLPGSFKCAMKAESPIVPVAIIDSYKPFGVNSLRRVTTQVHFLQPLYYEDYKDMTTHEVADLVRCMIIETIQVQLSQNEKKQSCA